MAICSVVAKERWRSRRSWAHPKTLSKTSTALRRSPNLMAMRLATSWRRWPRSKGSGRECEEEMTMGIALADLIGISPCLYHVTYEDGLGRIRRSRRLESAAALMDAGGQISW